MLTWVDVSTAMWCTGVTLDETTTERDWPMTTLEGTELDLSARYQIRGWEGIAFRIDGWEQKWEPYTTLVEVCPECEEEVFLDASDYNEDAKIYKCPREECAEYFDAPLEYEEDTGDGEFVNDIGGVLLVVMVGDDKRHKVDSDDLILLDELAYCLECGQVGCQQDGRERN